MPGTTQVAFGEKQIKLASGENLRVPATLRTKCKGLLFRQYATERKAANGRCWCGPKSAKTSFRYDGVSRTKFLELSACSAKGDLTSLGALDGVAEFNGRVQFARLRDIITEVASLCPSACLTMAPALRARIDRVELFIKRGLASHLRADAAAGIRKDCAEHCAFHAHADPASLDGACPAACTHTHTKRCAECSELSVLVQDIAVFLQAAEADLKFQLGPLAPAEGFKLGDFVSYRDATGNTHPATIVSISSQTPLSADADSQAPGPAYNVTYGFDGGLRRALSAQLVQRNSEPRIEQLREVQEMARRATVRLTHYHAHEVCP